MDTHAPSKTDVNVHNAPANDNASKEIKRPSLIELKGGRVVFRQKPVDWASGRSYMKGLVAFSEYLEAQTSPITSIPEEYLGVIAKLTHENDRSPGILCKHIKKTLCSSAENGSQDAQSRLDAVMPLDVIDKAVNRVADRRNYGLENAPAVLSVWRWEVRDLSLVQDSTAIKDLPAQRLEQRVQARDDFKVLWDSLPSGERDAVLKRKERGEPKTRPPRSNGEDKTDDIVEDASTTLLGTNIERDAKRPKEPKVQSAKQLALQAKEASTRKSAAVMASFFKPSTSKSSMVQSGGAENDFDRQFRPFAARKNVTLAPINRFKKSPGTITTTPEVIVLDGDGDVQMSEQAPTSGPTRTAKHSPLPSDPKAAIRDLVSLIPPSRRLRSSLYSASTDSRPFSGSSSLRNTASPSKLNDPPTKYILKSRSNFSVRKLMQQLNEAEINGDEKGTREIQALLRDRRRIPAKLLQFHDNLRPPYYGTWTKTSAFVGPRTPFAKDLAAFDYSYDSGDDWEEEEEPGEDILSDVDSEAEGVEEDDDDDGFLVPDDEVECIAASRAHSRSRSPGAFYANSGAKRKAEATGGARKRRQITGPLIPFSKGPWYENEFGLCDYEPFRAFRIQLLNDSPFGLDPFSFVSTSIEEYQAFTVAMKQQITGDIPSLSLYQPSGAAGKIPDLLPAPGVPLRARSSETDNVCSAQPGSPMPPPPLPQKERTGPAFNLPATAYPDFLRAIEGSEVPKPVLILELFEAFKHRCTNESGALRKGAVEKKLSEIAYKEKKIWHVRATEWAAAGLEPAR